MSHEMKVIEAELEELRKSCENSVPDSKLVTCVPSSIRVEITWVQIGHLNSFDPRGCVNNCDKRSDVHLVVVYNISNFSKSKPHTDIDQYGIHINMVISKFMKS